MKGIIDPMCNPNKLELRYLITRSTYQLNRASRIVWWKLRQASWERQQYEREALYDVTRIHGERI